MALQSPSLSHLVTLAHQAGEILHDCFGQHMQVDHKGIIDLVSEADHQSEQLLLGYIRQNFPGDRIVAEESGELIGLVY
jgi:myo-inositol-1(or 4)-monophosphatase